MSALNIAALKRKAGCSEGCKLAVRGESPNLEVWHTFVSSSVGDHGVLHVDTTEPEWVNGVIEWLRGLEHE